LNHSNLILIGMPGSGKSTVGVLAAKVLGLDFVDTDLLLQKQERLRLHEILDRDGPAGFLRAEDRLLAGILLESAVVSTGGSAVYHARGMVNLKGRGTVVWIDVPFDEIERRLGDIHSRGVVLAPGQTLKDLYDERWPLYRKWADLKLEVGREDLETTVGRLAELVLSFRKRNHEGTSARGATK
jgi:shikimate kinase